MTPRRILAVPVLVAVVLTLAGAVGTAPAAAAGPGYVRLAHLSPGTPPVDVLLASFRGGRFSTLLPAVRYGALSPYRRVTPGLYTVAVRPTGAAEDTPPMLRTTIRVASGKAYTVAGVGSHDDLSLQVLIDDLTRPSNGLARIRVVEASSVAPVVGVAASTGGVIARAATFPSVTRYAEVPARRLTLRATPEKPTVAAVAKAVDVKAGRIYTVLILDRGRTGIQLVVRTDAASSSRAPAGSVNTGLGGAALNHRGPRTTVPMYGLVLLGLAALAFFSRRRRRQ